MRFFTSLFFLASPLIPASAQLPVFSREAWYDSLSATPKLTYGQVAIGQSYVNATSAVTQWSDPSYYTKNPNFLDSAPIIDPIQYRLPDITFNATFADGYPRAWHVWLPKNYKKHTSAYGQDSFSVHPYNFRRFNIWYVLHGFTDNAFYPYYDSQQEWPGMPIWSNLTAFTYYNNYILVAPEGLINKVNIAANEVYPEFAWNAGINRCCSSQNPPQDDVDFLTQVRHRMTNLFQPKKQFLTGYSNGGYMVQRMACERRDLWDAFVTNAATVNINGTNEAELLADCDKRYASRRGPAKPMLLVHGQNDQRVSYQPTATFASAPANFLAWGRRNGCSGSPSTPKNLYSGNNTGFTSNYFFNTVQAKYGTKVKVYPPGVTNETFNGNPRYFNLNRLPFAPSTQSFQGWGCTLVELVSHYDYHVWPKRTTSIADNWIYHGNDLWELNEYAHSFFTRTCGARFFTDDVVDDLEINQASSVTIVVPMTILSIIISFIFNY